MSETLGARALKWLVEEGFTTEPLKEEGFIWLYRAYRGSGEKNKISVSQSTGEDKIVVATGVFLDDMDRSLMAGFPPGTRVQLVRELSKLLYACSTTAFRIDEDQGILKAVTLTHPIFGDGLSKDRFMAAISDLYRTQALVLLHLNDYLVQAPEGAKASSTTVPPPESEESAKKQSPEKPGKGGAEKCANCGEPIRPGKKFCMKCGTPVNRS